MTGRWRYDDVQPQCDVSAWAATQSVRFGKRAISYELEGLGRECKVLGMSRSAKSWTVTAECPSGIGNLGYVLSNGRLYRDEDMLRYAYVRCPTN